MKYNSKTGGSDINTKLTERELDVLKCASKGLTNREIGQVLYMSMHTAKWYISSIIAKLNAKNRAEAVYIATKQNIII